MPAIVTFDVAGPGLFVLPIDTGGDAELTWLEIYSEWKVWSTLGDNLKYPPAFRVVGGDPKGDGSNLGSSFFMRPPWRLRPAERDHRLRLVGNTLYDAPGIPIVVPTLGGFTVLVETEVSTLVEEREGISTQRLDEVWQTQVLGVGDAKTMTKPTGDGAGLEGTISIAGITYLVEQQNGGDTVVLRRTA